RYILVFRRRLSPVTTLFTYTTLFRSVQVALKKENKPGKRREGRVIKVLERGTREIVGTFQESAGFGFVVPDNQRFLRDIFIQKRSEEHTSELQSRFDLVCRLLLEKKK